MSKNALLIRVCYLAIVGAVAGVAGERLLGRVQTGTIVVAALVILLPVLLLMAFRKGAKGDVTSTVSWTLVMAVVCAAAAVVGNRLVNGASHNAQLVIAGLIATAVVAAIGVPLLLRSRKRQRARID